MILQYIKAVLLALLPGIPLLIHLYIKYWRTKFSYWRDREIPHIPGKFPYGSDKEFRKAEKFGGDIIQRMYREQSPNPYFGIYDGVNPVFVLRDPEAVRIVLAKEFSHFRDRSFIQSPDDDILSKHLFLLKGEKWRALRIKMSPVFTSGKLKAMFPLFIKCSEAMDSLLLSEVEGDINVKDLTARYSTDVICSCAFGLEADSINNADSVFRKIGSQGDHRAAWQKFIQGITMNYVPFIKFSTSRGRITPKSLEDFMMKTVRETVEHREKTGQKRNDFIDLLIQLRNKGNLAEVTEDEDKSAEPIEMTLEVMAAQCFVFFVAGHETSSSVKTYCLYELALHPEIQERLHKEISDTLVKHGEITYQAVQEMEYLDMVVNETLRKYPTLMNLDRSCGEDFTFPGGQRLERGTKVLIPVWALHRDPEIYPEPERFDPERFTQENRESRHPFAFIPFGEGPRICIGQRFGLLQVKMGLITFLRKYRVEPCEKTPIPLEYMGTTNPLVRPTKPIILRLTKRE